jgi:hypothetical protein
VKRRNREPVKASACVYRQERLTSAWRAEPCCLR